MQVKPEMLNFSIETYRSIHLFVSERGRFMCKGGFESPDDGAKVSCRRDGSGNWATSSGGLRECLPSKAGGGPCQEDADCRNNLVTKKLHFKQVFQFLADGSFSVQLVCEDGECAPFSCPRDQDALGFEHGSLIVSSGDLAEGGCRAVFECNYGYVYDTVRGVRGKVGALFVDILIQTFALFPNLLRSTSSAPGLTAAAAFKASG